jgi:sulfate/thiosulfate transport system substrate-binding protein
LIDTIKKIVAGNSRIGGSSPAAFPTFPPYFLGEGDSLRTQIVRSARALSATLPRRLSTKSIEKGNNPLMTTLFRKLRRRRGAQAAAGVILAVGLAGGVAACGGSSSGDSGSGGSHISLVAYSTPGPAYTDHLIPAFQKTSQGQGASFSTSFAASGDQARAVEAGQPASVVHFSLTPDMQGVVDAGKVAKNWDQNPYHGFVQDSVVTFVVRKGNPKGIKTWDDLVKPGVQVVTPNPFSSGSARWNLMGAYGAKLEEGDSPAQAQAFLKKLLEHTVVQPPAASDALTAFTSGKGDVLLSYENDAIAAKKAGESVDYVIPPDTILIQTPIATTTDAPSQAKAFVKWLYTPTAQQIWADQGYRPVVKSVLAKNKSKFPTPPGLFTINKVGGWDKVATKFFDPTKGIVAGFEKDLGVSVGG